MLNWTTETLKLLHDANFVVSFSSSYLLHRFKMLIGSESNAHVV